VLLRAPKPPRAVTLAGEPVSEVRHSAADRLLWLRFTHQATPRSLVVSF
jgi:hypothetical protein